MNPHSINPVQYMGEFVQASPFGREIDPNAVHVTAAEVNIRPATYDAFESHNILPKPKRYIVVFQNNTNVEYQGFGIGLVDSDPHHFGILADARDSTKFVAVFLASQVVSICPAT